MDNKKLGTFEAISLILVIIISHLLLNIPQSILNTCGSSSLLNIVYISIIAILLGLLAVKLISKFPNSDLIDISDYLGGKVLKTILGIILIVYMLFSASILLRTVTEALKLIYFFDAKITFTAMFFIITCIIANSFSSQSIIRTNLIITPIILLVLIIAFASVSPLFVWQRIFPIFGYGIDNTFGFEGISNLFAYNGLFIIMLIFPLLRVPQKFKKISITALIITGILLLLFIGALLFSFPHVLSIESIIPIYLVVVNTQFSTFFQRPEALFIYFFIMFFISYLNIIIMFLLKIFKKISKIENPKPLACTFSTLLFICAFIPVGMTEIRFLENTVYKYLTIAVTFILSFSILIGANIKHFILQKRMRS